MKRTSSIFSICLAAILMSALPACSSVNQPAPSPIPFTATATTALTPTQTLEPSPTASPTITRTPRPTLPPFPDLPTPRSGAGSVVGRVLWNDLPSKDVTVKLCEKHDIFTTCGGKQYATTSDADGIYVFNNVTAGSYAVIFKVIGATEWLILSGINPFEGTRYKVASGQILRMKDTIVFKNDIVLSEPSNGAVVRSENPLFAWNPYPGAALYEVKVYTSNSATTRQVIETTETSLTFPLPLWVCSYRWDVKAFNAAGTVLAEREGKFSITGDGLSCKITITSPLNAAYLPAEPFTITWEPHPEAGSYTVHLFGLGISKIHDGTSKEPTYVVNEILPKGDYAITVCAIKSITNRIACSEDFRIHIR
jgi:hypothetical protein